MYLKNVLIRFYKSFNFDYLRKFNPKVEDKFQWERVNGSLWYPYVRIPIERGITAIVGENESGKSHLLDAIQKGIDGKGIEREDFCRYSHFFTVEAGKLKLPDFGFEFAGLSASDLDTLSQTCDMESTDASQFHLFRNDRDQLSIYFAQSNNPQSVTPSSINKLLPTVFRLKENIGLPRSVPIRFLAGDKEKRRGFELFSRKQRSDFFETVLNSLGWFENQQKVAQHASDIASAFSGFGVPTIVTEKSDPTDKEWLRQQDELALAHDLIHRVAKIDNEALRDLFKALENGRDAYANSIIEEINDALATKLNFPHWWVQDSQFQLKVSARDYDLVFTICDRTGREYSFGERSSGLRYFLSYYIQYLAHEFPEDDACEILLMDEPDAFLSSQGQQDLLKIFDAFTASGNTQVIYVTHSPFLIDKNHSERIRVLEKGIGDEGTRVVRDVSRNHYEPLRSAFGSLVAETTFMSNCNLMTEGPADQVLLAGATRHLRSREEVSELETLDLNHLTIVPASGASYVPYLVYLARGRDIEKPAVIVLLDSDTPGDDAKKGILRGGPRRKQLVKPELILQVGQLANDDTDLVTATGKDPIETEDLIPLPICVEAARMYLKTIYGSTAGEAEKLTANLIEKHLEPETSVFKAIEASFAGLSNKDHEFHIEKVGFARCVVDTIAHVETNSKDADITLRNAIHDYEANMKVLFQKLRSMQRKAVRELTSERVSHRLGRAQKSFLQDHPDDAKREHAVLLFEEIEMALDDSLESDHITNCLQTMRREFKLTEDLTEEIDGYDKFKEGILELKYAGRIATQDPSAEPISSTDSPKSTTADRLSD